MTEIRTTSAPSGIGRTVVGFLEYALMFTVIIECNSLFHYSENYRGTTLEVVATVIGIGLAALLAVIWGCRCKQEIREDLKRNLPLWAALLACVFFFLALNVLRIGGENALRKYALSFVLFFPIAWLLFRLYRIAGRPYALFFRHADLVCILAVCDLLVFAAVTLRPEIIRGQMLQTRWTGLGYLTGLCSYLDVCCVSMGETRTIAGFTIYRNIGFFPEPLMFCIPLLTALFTEMFLRRREDRRPWKWAVLLLAVFSSQATLGMLLGALAVGLKCVEGGKALRKRWYVPALALVLMAAAFAALLWQKSSLGGSSITNHMEHYAAALRAFRDHPLLGCGYLREEEILKYVSASHLARSHGLSNSVAVVLAEGGLFLCLMCMAPFLFGLLQFRSPGGKGLALWTVGPLGLYCLTVFHFHLLLMLFMAFGCSLPELRSDGGGRRRLHLVEDGEAPAAGESSVRVPQGARIAALLAAAAAAAALFLSGGFWRLLSRWLKLHQLYFGQSAWHVYFFSLFLILAVLVLRFALSSFGERRERRWVGETVWFLLWTAVFAAAYPAAWSAAATVLDWATPFGDLFETGALAAVYFGGVGAGWLLIAWQRRRKALFAAGLAAALVLTAGGAAAVFLMISRLDVQAAPIAQAVREAAAAAEGKVYSDEAPAAMKRAVPELALSPARDGAFAAQGKASVVAAHSRNLRDLLEAGFQVCELSPEYLLYSNDGAVIGRLRQDGYGFSKYYPYELPADHESAEVLKSGIYTLTAQLRRSPDAEDPDGPVCHVRITSYYGKNEIADQPVYGEDFDEGGSCTVSVRFTAGDWEGMTYSVLSAEGSEAPAASLTLRETPEYLTETTYDGRYLPVREACYDLSGEPCLTDGGYAATTLEYDRAGRILRQSYFGTDGLPVRIGEGYASYERTYDRKGRLSREAYFDESGAPCLTPQGYAALVREYNKKGLPESIRYLDASEQPVMTAMGYAELRYAYDGWRRITELSYFDEKGERMLVPKGYWREQREYDSDGNVTVQRYCDTEEQPVITTMGYAEIRKRFNENRKVISEEYFGVRGEPVALPGGQASMVIEYGPDGKETARHYYDLSGEELAP